MGKFAHDSVVPDLESNLSKKEQVALMFDRIAFRYDFLNRFLSAGIDVGWRKKAISTLKQKNPKIILDVATGTADVAILTAKILSPHQIIGIDISEGMLELGRKKIKSLQLEQTIELKTGDSEDIKFENNEIDAVTVAFGVRNFQNLEKGLTEILRVLKPGGQLVVLEFSKPTLPVVKECYWFYMNVVTPFLGKLFSSNKKAYEYLNQSVQKFPEGKAFEHILQSIGYKNTTRKPLTLGICTIYTGEK
jgi:demethylmenaquinone methyltransferase/2-methoxy-6-polyprenyl-1,4-benzoquinol methylase